MIFLAFQYFKISTHKRGGEDSFEKPEEFYLLKEFFINICKVSNLSPIRTPLPFDENLEHSQSDVEPIFVFSQKDFKCLDNHHQEGNGLGDFIEWQVEKPQTRLSIFDRGFEKSRLSTKTNTSKSPTVKPTPKSYQCCPILKIQSKVLENFKMDCDLMITEYEAAISQSLLTDSSYKSLTEQMVTKDQEYLALTKNRDKVDSTSQNLAQKDQGWVWPTWPRSGKITVRSWW